MVTKAQVTALEARAQRVRAQLERLRGEVPALDQRATASALAVQQAAVAEAAGEASASALEKARREHSANVDRAEGTKVRVALVETGLSQLEQEHREAAKARQAAELAHLEAKLGALIQKLDAMFREAAAAITLRAQLAGYSGPAVGHVAVYLAKGLEPFCDAASFDLQAQADRLRGELLADLA